MNSLDHFLLKVQIHFLQCSGKVESLNIFKVLDFSLGSSFEPSSPVNVLEATGASEFQAATINIDPPIQPRMIV